MWHAEKKIFHLQNDVMWHDIQTDTQTRAYLYAPGSEGIKMGTHQLNRVHEFTGPGPP